jgi:AraC-like DNA-binding protein
MIIPQLLFFCINSCILRFMYFNSQEPWTKIEAERQVCPKGDERFRLVRSAWMLYFTVSGEWELSMPGRELVVGAGDVVWIPAGMMVDQRYPCRTVLNTLRLRAGAWVPHAEGDMETVAFRNLLDQVTRGKGLVLPLEKQTRTGVRTILGELIGYWGEPKAGLHRTEMKAGAMRLFGLLTRDPRLQAALASPKNTDKPQEAQRRVVRALELLNNRDFLASGGGSVTELAEACRLKVSRFHGLFLEATGVTPNQYLTQRRVALASQLLADAEQSVLDVAFASGFATQSRFYTAFKAVTGMTPMQWRRVRL